MSSKRTAAVEQFWSDFCASHGVAVDQRYDVYRFGDSREMADELVDLVIHGPKRATAGLLMDVDPQDEPLPEVGIYSIILDGIDRPRCVVRTTEVEVKPLRDADASFAWDEGEGERTLEWWLEAHTSYFTRDLARRGVAFSEELPAVFERFELVWEPEDEAR